MASFKTNKHLNVFNYYNYSDKHDSKENNLTRALAITLSNDRRFLNDIFKLFTLDDSYSNLFSLDYNLIDNEDIYIDIQKPSDSTELVNGISDKSYKNYIGVLIGSFDEEIVDDDQIKNIESNNTENPIPDIIIAIKDTLVIIEAKLGGNKNSLSQLKGQVESIINNTTDIEKINPNYKIVDWEEIIKCAMSYTNQSKTKENLLVYDFVDFVRRYRTDFMPVIPISEIEINNKVSDYYKKLINQRLDILKTIVTQKEIYFNKSELLYENERGAIPIGFGWASEANLFFDEKSKKIKLDIWPADTKTQGWKIYNKDKELSWLNRDKIKINKCDYNLNIEPYIKFASSWGSNISHIWDTLNQNKKYKRTHNYIIFKEMAGEWRRNENDRWKKNGIDLERKLNKLIGKGWQNDANWDENFIDSNRTVVNLSFGINVEVEIPYLRAQMLDDDKDNPKLAKEIYDLLIRLKEMIDQ